MGSTIMNRRNSSTNNIGVIRNTQQPFPFYVGKRRRNDKANEYRLFFAPLNQCHNCTQYIEPIAF